MSAEWICGGCECLYPAAAAAAGAWLAPGEHLHQQP